MRAKCPEIFLPMKDEPGYHFRILLVHKETSMYIQDVPGGMDKTSGECSLG